MHRQILEACLPSFVCLAVLFGALGIVLKLARVRPDWRRLLNIHRCQQGGVQSLSFVLTLPAFLMIMLFIIQVSQLMIGIIVVNYSAFAAARSASVWIPAAVGSEAQNVLQTGSVATRNGNVLSVQADTAVGSTKCEKIWQAAVLACMPIAPSRDLTDSAQTAGSWVDQTTSSIQMLYSRLGPTRSRDNPRMAARLRNKLRYAARNTFVEITWQEAPHFDAPAVSDALRVTYNPLGDVSPHPTHAFNPNEVGWEDPITVRVVHRYALLTSAGRFLAVYLVPGNGRPTDRISTQIITDRTSYRETVHSIEIPASATLVNEGLKPVIGMGYVQTP